MRNFLILFILNTALALTASAQNLGVNDFENTIPQLGSSAIRFDQLLLTLKTASARSSDLLIPFSRSLQADASSLENPRLVVGLDLHPNHPPSFLGYAAKAEQAEVIAWNPQTSRYDFLVVTHLGDGKIPQIERPERALCMQCHQAGGPIFSHFPWTETSFNLDVLLALKKASPTRDTIEGDAFGFDALVREANSTLQKNQICTDLCAGKPSQCRKTLLYSSLIQARFKTSRSLVSRLDPKNDADLILQLKGWIGNRDFAYVSSVIPDRSVSIASPSSSTTFLTRAENLRDERRTIEQILNGNLPPENSLYSSIADFDRTKGFNTYLEEASTIDLVKASRSIVLEYYGVKSNEPSSASFKRPLVQALATDQILNQLPDLSNRCIPISEPQLERIKNIPNIRLKRFLLELPEAEAWAQGKSLSDSGVFDRIATLWDTEIRRAYPDARFEPIPNATPSDLRVVTQLDRQQAAQTIQETCLKCHKSGGRLDLKIDWTNLDQVKAYRADDGVLLIDRIRQNEMPPKADMITPAQRDQLVRVLK